MTRLKRWYTVLEVCLYGIVEHYELRFPSHLPAKAFYHLMLCTKAFKQPGWLSSRLQTISIVVLWKMWSFLIIVQ